MLTKQVQVKAVETFFITSRIFSRIVKKPLIQYIKWKPSTNGWYALNIDCFMANNPSLVEAGDLIRNSLTCGFLGFRKG